MNQERLLKIILGPHVSEKTTILADKHKQYVFKVLADANKIEIKSAVEALFNVKVDSVRVLNVKSKLRHFRQMVGYKKAWKKAYVSLKDGDINFADLK